MEKNGNRPASSSSATLCLEVTIWPPNSPVTARNVSESHLAAESHQGIVTSEGHALETMVQGAFQEGVYGHKGPQGCLCKLPRFNYYRVWRTQVVKQQKARPDWESVTRDALLCSQYNYPLRVSWVHLCYLSPWSSGMAWP